MAPEVAVVLEGYTYFECPRWHENRIWVSDFYTYQVISACEDGTDIRVEAEVPGQPSGLGWLPDGRLLVVSMRDQKILRRESDGELVVHADLSGYVSANVNDMLVDAQGRAYVGNFGFDLMNLAPVETADLLRVDPDGSVHVVARDLHFPNGMALTSTGDLLVDETLGNRISAFAVQADGSLGERRDWASFGPVPGGSRDGDHARSDRRCGGRVLYRRRRFDVGGRCPRKPCSSCGRQRGDSRRNCLPTAVSSLADSAVPPVVLCSFVPPRISMNTLARWLPKESCCRFAWSL